MTSRRFLLGLILALPGAAALAAPYPSKPVRIIVPYQAGQGTDVATRYIAELLGKSLGQPVVVENKAGAGGNIGAAEAARAPADGYTLVMGTNGTHVLNQLLYPSMPYDAEKDFEPVALVSTFPMVILANVGVPYNSFAEFLADARARTDTVNVALPSTTARLVLELLQQQSGAQFRAVPYKGSSTSMTDLIGGQVSIGIDTASAARPFVASGRLKALAQTSRGDSALLPGTRSVAASGLNDFEVLAWNALYAPRGTPAAVVQRLSEEVSRILAQPEVRRRLLELGHESAGGSRAQLAAFAAAERRKWGPLVKSVGLKIE
jgi:tripartite-type tricarboxylate transporter receptor subunit TctC